MSVAQSGKTQSLESRQKRSKTMKGRPAHNKGKARSLESRVKQSQTTMDKLHPWMQGRIPWNKGKKNTQVPWNKGKKGLQVAWNKGISPSDETRHKWSVARTGKKHSEESKRKRGESLKKTWASKKAGQG